MKTSQGYNIWRVGGQALLSTHVCQRTRLNLENAKTLTKIRFGVFSNPKNGCGISRMDPARQNLLQTEDKSEII